MLKFTTIRKAVAILVGMGAAAAANASQGATVTKNEHLTERSPAPHFKYDVRAVGPIESRRAEYVTLRDKIADLLGPDTRIHFFIKTTQEYRDLKDKLDAIPLEEKWVEAFGNLVTTVGKNDLLTNQFKGSSYTAAWYLGLIDNSGFSAVAAGDTMSSHGGWTESTAYSDGARKTLSFGTASSGSLAASAASFSINGSATINGAFCVTNSTKGGTTGTLYSAGSFSATRTVANGDTLNVTLTVTA